MSKRQQDQVAAERMEQLRIKEDIEQQRKAEDDMYAKLWYDDMEAKVILKNYYCTFYDDSDC